MGEFLAFVLIVFAAGWGSAFLVPYLKRHSKKLDRTVDQETLGRLLEEVDRLSGRVTHVEEELDFYRELRGPKGRDRLPPPADREEVGQ